MSRAKALALLVLLLSYGAVGARQPAVRSSVALPAPAAALAETFGFPVADRSRIVLDIIRLMFGAPDGQDARNIGMRGRLDALIHSSQPGETAPLPLDPAIWRETILKRDVPDAALLGAILSDRRTALLYHGLAALDDETLGWLGPERDLIEHLLRHSGTFAFSARSLQIRGGQVVVPGGSDAASIWESVVGAPPSRPASFVRRLFSDADGRLAAFYDGIAQLDETHRRLVLEGDRRSDSRTDHVRALARVFERSFGELRVEERPFTRHAVDPWITLATLAVTPEGTLAGPTDKALWEIVFRKDEGIEPEFEIVRDDELSARVGKAVIDPAWLSARIHDQGPTWARRRLDTVLFAQRVFRDLEERPSDEMGTALRGMLAFPALMLTLERCGITSPRLLAAAAGRAHALNAIAGSAQRSYAIRLFQASLGIIERATSTSGLDRAAALSTITSLVALDLSGGDREQKIAGWLQLELLPLMARRVGTAAAGSVESVMLMSMAGFHRAAMQPEIEWEGRKYRVNPQAAELARLRQIRDRQYGPSLDDALAPAAGRGNGSGDPESVSLADVLTSILYAAHMGDSNSRLLSADNVALRHDLAFEGFGRAKPLASWRIAGESLGDTSGWRLSGSLLGLDAALARFTVRRLDLTTMPPAPRLTSSEIQTASLTAALMRPAALSDEVRDEIAAAVKRGRARLDALRHDPTGLERVAREAGISEWRREALAWQVEHDPGHVESQLSPLELMWLGSPRPSAAGSLDSWGAAALPLTGCLCLEMPDPLPWESFGGRPSAGLFAARGADLAVRLAEEFSEMRLPGALIPGVLAFAMQDVLDAAQPAYFDDWSEFGRSVRAISKDRLVDYVAALASGGPLLPIETDDRN